jgi:hypothetical protein
MYLTPFGKMRVTMDFQETCSVSRSSASNFMKIIQTWWSAHKAPSYLLLKSGRNTLFGKGKLEFLWWHGVTLTDVHQDASLSVLWHVTSVDVYQRFDITWWFHRQGVRQLTPPKHLYKELEANVCSSVSACACQGCGKVRGLTVGQCSLQ